MQMKKSRLNASFIQTASLFYIYQCKQGNKQRRNLLQMKKLTLNEPQIYLRLQYKHTLKAQAYFTLN